MSLDDAPNGAPLGTIVETSFIVFAIALDMNRSDGVVIAIAIARPHSTMATASVRTLPLLVVSTLTAGERLGAALSCLSNKWHLAHDSFILSAVRTASPKFRAQRERHAD
ncbi:hypothetical protein FB45DRAFT_1064713 [Roridomyces roridus]|uniref:Uncharacterized protein n=1 Tax=Roridomyces roridus TaxID=1738132 RepID=A0AAD7B955_9AGAR|nr:hypothetical protein FB45DRAFT_1064713 [Roridomyces roridus]